MEITPRSGISFVLPCLNEEKTLADVLIKINQVRDSMLKDRESEIIVSDNGSTDHSVEIARSNGANVLHCTQPGYGAALKYGFEHARYEVIIFADSDGTYDFSESSHLVERIDQGYDLVTGSRLHGKIYPGAMPFLHRYLGTPMLNLIINLLYAGQDTTISDCNSGFRCFRKQAFESWQVRGDGMEFASEMLVKALKNKARISEVPISLYPDRRDRVPHLKTWRDGMRHLLQILVESPAAFHFCGITFWLISWLILLTGLILGPQDIFGAALFGLHTMMFAALGSFFGQTIWSIGLFLSTKQKSDVKIYTHLLNMPEDRVFWMLSLLFLFSAICFGVIVVRWGLNGFRDLYLEKETLSLVTFAANGILFLSGLFTAHLIKRM